MVQGYVHRYDCLLPHHYSDTYAWILTKLLSPLGHIRRDLHDPR